MDRASLEEIVLNAMQNANLARTDEEQLVISPTASLFGPGGQLDSMGLVSLIIDVEESLQERGIAVSLNDARAMSETQSPFRSVPALVEYIQKISVSA